MGGIDINFIMDALTSKVKRMFRAELEQFHERVEQSFEQPRKPSDRVYKGKAAKKRGAGRKRRI